MFDLGWSELLLIGIVALIVVGPKDLPGMFRALGQFTGKARAMAREFSRAMEAAADESGVKEVSNTLKEASKGLNNPKAYGANRIREATGLKDSAKDKAAKETPAAKPGGETERLSAERAEAKRKVSEATARAATARKEREAAAEAALADAGPAEPPAEPKRAEAAVKPEGDA